MELTGKCKEEFEKWYYSQYCYPEFRTEEYSGNGLGFIDLDDSMQYGVYVDFFDSVGVVIELQCDSNYSVKTFLVLINDEFKGFGASRQEARTKAIEKASAAYNDLY